MLISLLLTLALAGDCDLAAPVDAEFAVASPEAAEHVTVMVELWSQPEFPQWTPTVLQALKERGLRASIVVPLPPPEGPDEATLAWLEEAVAAGHEVVIRFNERQIPTDPDASLVPMRKRFKAVRKLGTGHTALAPLVSRRTEAMLGKMGFRTILQDRGPATAISRMAVVFEGQPRIGSVLGNGPYAGSCGIRPSVRQFTPRAADRATRAIWGASRIEGMPTVRVALLANEDGEQDAQVLGRWLDQRVQSAGAQLGTPDDTRKQILAYFRTGAIMQDNPLEGGGGRLVSVEQVREAAAGLHEQNILPRTLPGDLNLTESFLAFALLLTGEVEGDVVRLTRLAGPEQEASARTTGVVDVDREALMKTTRALLAELPERVPSMLPVGDRLLTAGELLTALGSAVRQDVPQSWPTASPDPNAPGQGWGESELP